MLQCRAVSIKALSRSISFPFHRVPTIRSRIFFQPHPNACSRLQSLNKALKCQFSSTPSPNARGRSVQRSTQPPPPPPSPGPEPGPEYYVPPDLPPKKVKEPGSGLSKLFLAVTIPILLLSISDEIARLTVSREEICEALGVDPSKRPSIEAYNHYIQKFHPDKAYWLGISDMMKRNFSFVARNFAGSNPNESFRWWTLLTSEFNHGGFIHLYCCYAGFRAFAPVLAHLYGNHVTATCFLVGGIMAQAFVGFYEKTTNPFVKMSPTEVNQRFAAGLTKEDEKRLKRACAWSMGSSTSLMTMGTICAIVYPTMKLNIILIPISIPIRVCLGAFVAFDLGGMIYDYGIPIGHTGHIGGVVAGALLYALWIRKLPTVMQRRIQQAMRERGIRI